MNQGTNWLLYLKGFRLCLNSWTRECLPAPSAKFTLQLVRCGFMGHDTGSPHPCT